MSKPMRSAEARLSPFRVQTPRFTLRGKDLVQDFGPRERRARAGKGAANTGERLGDEAHCRQPRRSAPGALVGSRIRHRPPPLIPGKVSNVLALKSR